jgi:hypothetical protein
VIFDNGVPQLRKKIEMLFGKSDSAVWQQYLLKNGILALIYNVCLTTYLPQAGIALTLYHFLLVLFQLALKDSLSRVVSLSD